jgi:hypothetical protein
MGKFAIDRKTPMILRQRRPFVWLRTWLLLHHKVWKIVQDYGTKYNLLLSKHLYGYQIHVNNALDRL